jgi:hypothetical protein
MMHFLFNSWWGAWIIGVGCGFAFVKPAWKDVKR